MERFDDENFSGPLSVEEAAVLARKKASESGDCVCLDAEGVLICADPSSAQRYFEQCQHVERIEVAAITIKAALELQATA